MSCPVFSAADDCGHYCTHKYRKDHTSEPWKDVAIDRWRIPKGAEIWPLPLNVICFVSTVTRLLHLRPQVCVLVCVYVVAPLSVPAVVAYFVSLDSFAFSEFENFFFLF